MARDLPALEVWLVGTDIPAQLEHLRHGGLLLPVPHPAPEPLSDVQLRVFVGQNQPVILDANIVHVGPDEVALTVDESERLGAILACADSTQSGSTRTEWMQAENVEDIHEGTDLGTLYDTIRNMSTTQKRKAARHGSRAERMVLMKDTNKSIHAMVIQNPRITLDEVRYLAGFRQAGAEALKRIGQNEKWVGDAGIATALVRNPRTPTTVAVGLLSRLPKTELQRLAKSNDVPRAVSAAARKKVLVRSSD